MRKDYPLIKDIFRKAYPSLKKSVSNFSKLSQDHSRFWDGIENIEIDMDDVLDELTIDVYLNGEFLDFPIMNMDHFHAGNAIIFPWIEKGFLNVMNIKPRQEFKSAKFIFHDKEGATDSGYIWRYK